MDTFLLVSGRRARYVFDFGSGDLTEGRYGSAPAKLTKDQLEHIFATWQVKQMTTDSILYRRPKEGHGLEGV